jgi:dipeptidyl aminopeptidase/acylaminoacyl peptidase
MRKFKYIFFALFLMLVAKPARALDIQYSTTLSVSGSTFLIDMNGIDARQHFLCSTVSAKCTATKKTSLGKTPSATLSKSIRTVLDNKNADHPTVSRSGTYLAYFIAGNYLAPTRTYTLRNLKTGAESTLSDSVSYWDLVDGQPKVFAFSPDNKKLIYLDDRDGVLSLYMSPVTTTHASITSTKLALGGCEINDFIFTDSNTLYYIANTKDNPYAWSLYRYVFSTGEDSILATNVSYVDPLHYIGHAIVFNEQQAQGYGPVMYNVLTKKVSTFSVPGIDTRNPVINESVIESGDVHGVLMTPATIDPTKTYPLLVWLHGGPYRQTSFGYHPYHSYGIYDSMLQLLQKNNVIVLKLDYPGSEGMGRSYAESLQGSIGKIDVANVMDALTYMKSRYPNISATYLAGNSYGGYLSLASVVQHPTAFTGVISINGVTDWASLLELIKTSIFNTHFGGLPSAVNQTLYDQASILNKIGNLGNQKIEIIQGQADQTIAPSQAELLYNALIQAGKNVSIIRYPGQDHVYSGSKTIDDLCTQMFNFIGVPADAGCTK